MSYPFLEEPVVKSGDAFGYRIYMAGDYDVARQVCREYCAENGACISLTRTDYIYSGGEETGFTAMIANYPRFPSYPDRLRDIAHAVGTLLMKRLGQGSYMIEPYGLPEHIMTTWISRRKSD